MRQRSTKERRKERQEFVYMFRNEIENLLKIDCKSFREVPAIKEFAEMARRFLEYSNSTYFVDIWLTLRREFYKLYPPQKK